MSIEKILQARWLLTELVGEGTQQFEKWYQTVDEPTRQAIDAVKNLLAFYNYEPSLAELLALKQKQLVKMLKTNAALTAWFKSNLSSHFLQASKNWNQQCFEYLRASPNASQIFESLRIQGPQIVREYLDDPKLLQQPSFSSKQLLVLMHLAGYFNPEKLITIGQCLDSKELPKHLVECLWLSLDHHSFINELATQVYLKRLVYEDLSPRFKSYICHIVKNQNNSTLAFKLISTPVFFDYLRQEDQQALMSLNNYTYNHIYLDRPAPLFVRLLAESYYIKKQYAQTQVKLGINITEKAKQNLRDLKKRLREMPHPEKKQPSDLLTPRETVLFEKLLNRPFIVQHGTSHYQKIKSEGVLSSVERRRRQATDKHLAMLPKNHADPKKAARENAVKEVASNTPDGTGNNESVFWAFISTSDANSKATPNYGAYSTTIALNLGQRLSEHPYEAQSWWCSESFFPYTTNHIVAPVLIGKTLHTVRYRRGAYWQDVRRTCIYQLPNGEVREEVFTHGSEIAIGMNIPVFRYLRMIEQLRHMDEETYQYILNNIDNDAVIDTFVQALTRVRGFELYRVVRQPLNIPEVKITPADNVDLARLTKLCQSINDGAPVDVGLLTQNFNITLTPGFKTEITYKAIENNNIVDKKFSLAISHPFALAVANAAVHNSLHWVEELIKHGADINYQGSDTVTAILVAIAYENELLVKLLINKAKNKQDNRVSYPVNMNVITANMTPNFSPITLATQKKNLSIMRLVLENGGADSEVFLKEAIEFADNAGFEEGFFLLLQYVPNPWAYYSKARASSANRFIEVSFEKFQRGVSPKEFLSVIATNDDLLKEFIKLPQFGFISVLKKVKDESVISDYFKLLVSNKHWLALDLSLLGSIVSLPKTLNNDAYEILTQAVKWDYFTKDNLIQAKEFLEIAKQKTADPKHITLKLLCAKLDLSRCQLTPADIFRLVEKNESQMLADEDYIIAATPDQLMLKLMACELKTNQESKALMGMALLFDVNFGVKDKELQAYLAVALKGQNLSSALKCAYLLAMGLSDEEVDYAMLYLQNELAAELKISSEYLALSESVKIDYATTVERMRRIKLMISKIKILHYVNTAYPDKVPLIQEVIKEHSEALTIIDTKKEGKEQLFDLLKVSVANPESKPAPKVEMQTNNAPEKAVAKQKVADCKHIYYIEHFNKKFMPNESKYLAADMQQDEKNYRLLNVAPEHLHFYKHAREKLKYKISDAVTYTEARSRNQSDAAAQFKAKPSLRNWYRVQWDSAINRALMVAVSCTLVGAFAMLIVGLHESGVLREDKRIAKDKKPIDQTAYDKKVSDYQVSRKNNQAVWQASVARRCLQKSKQLPEMQKRIMLCSGG